jgi:hypothetical protein
MTDNPFGKIRSALDSESAESSLWSSNRPLPAETVYFVEVVEAEEVFDEITGDEADWSSGYFFKKGSRLGFYRKDHVIFRICTSLADPTKKKVWVEPDRQFVLVGFPSRTGLSVDQELSWESVMYGAMRKWLWDGLPVLGPYREAGFIGLSDGSPELNRGYPQDLLFQIRYLRRLQSAFRNRWVATEVKKEVRSSEDLFRLA